jgi:hypothetical protein
MALVKNSKSSIFLLLVAILLLGSCASKPPAPTPEPVPVEVPKAPEPIPEPVAPAAPAISQAELDDLLSQVKELKKKAFDLKLFEILPDDYKAAEGVYGGALASYQAASKDLKEAPAAKSGLEASLGTYKELIAKGVVELAKARRDDADAMKATALKVGADAKAADRFKAADEVYAAAAALLEESKHEEAVTGFETARLYFELAYKRAIAGELRASILEKDYGKWDSGNNQLAENKYSAEEGLWASGVVADRASGVDMLDESILRWNLVVQKGRQTVASGAKEKTDDSKARSEQVKAQVAVKDQYQAALGTYEDAVSKLASESYEEAAAAFEQAQAAFDEAYAAAAEKRAKAQAAMESAAAAGADSARKAAEADQIVGQAAGQ